MQYKSLVLLAMGILVMVPHIGSADTPVVTTATNLVAARDRAPISRETKEAVQLLAGHWNYIAGVSGHDWDYALHSQWKPHPTSLTYAEVFAEELAASLQFHQRILLWGTQSNQGILIERFLADIHKGISAAAKAGHAEAFVLDTLQRYMQETTDYELRHVMQKSVQFAANKADENYRKLYMTHD